jgi:hypothetical protein
MPADSMASVTRKPTLGAGIRPVAVRSFELEGSRARPDRGPLTLPAV